MSDTNSCQSLSIIGAGNGGYATAVHLSQIGHRVTLYESPNFVGKRFVELLEKRFIKAQGFFAGETKISIVTTDIEQAMSNEVILIIVPAFAHSDIARQIVKYLRDGHILILLTGNMGSLEIYQVLQKLNCDLSKVTIAETNTLPYGCRLLDEENTVNIPILTQSLWLAAFPANKTDRPLQALSQLYQDFSPGVRSAKNIAFTLLNNPNPTIHIPGVLLNAARIQHSNGEFWMYEEGFTSATHALLRTIDEERKSIGDRLGIEIIKYDQFQSTVMQEGIPTDKSFLECGACGSMKGPTSLDNRYITEDIPYSLSLFSAFGRKLGVPTPVIDAEIQIGSAICCQNFFESGRTFQELGLESCPADQVITFLQNGYIP